MPVFTAETLRQLPLLRRTHRFSVQAQAAAHVEEGGHIACSGGQAQLLLHSDDGAYPQGWTRIRLRISTASEARPSLRLCANAGAGFAMLDGRHLPLPAGGCGQIDYVQALPAHVRGLRLDVEASQPLRFTLHDVHMQPLTQHEALLRVSLQALRRRRPGPRQLWSAGKRIVSALQQGGIGGAVCDVQARTHRGDADYVSWIDQFATLTETDRALIRERLSGLEKKPCISVLMPVYNVEEPYLRLAIESVRAQLYPNWQLCIADDCSTAPHIPRVLREYAAKDARIKVMFRPTNGHMSAAYNSALELATGAYVCILDHDDELTEHALYMAVEELNAHPEAMLIYSDEDKIDVNGTPYDPYFKPDWNPDLFLSQNCVSHLEVFPRQLAQEIGGFRLGVEGSQDYDIILRLTEKLRPEQIRHIPHVLYHWRAIRGSTALSSSHKLYAYDASHKALETAFSRRGIAGHVQPTEAPGFYRPHYALPAVLPTVTVIVVPQAGADAARVRRCVTTLARHTGQQPDFVILAGHGGDLTEFPVTVQAPGGGTRLEQINRAVAEARGDIVMLCDDGLEARSETWLEEMLSHALRPQVGAVGAKIYTPDGAIWHAGVVLGLGGHTAGHAHRHVPASYAGYFARAKLVQNFSAVSGACLMVRKDLFCRVGGLDPAYVSHHADVDLCLRLQALGLRNVWTPHAEFTHHGVAARQTPAPAADTQLFEERFAGMVGRDPSFNPNLSLHSEDFALAFPPRAPKPWLAAPGPTP